LETYRFKPVPPAFKEISKTCDFLERVKASITIDRSF
jgi:hypothetical protein